MKLHRFFVDSELKAGSLKLQDEELLNQLRSVLKLKIGEKIILCDGKGNESTTEIKEYGKNHVLTEVEDVRLNQNESDRNVILYCSVLKKENFELVVQKATEIGVKEIIPIISERTVKMNIRRDRMEKIIKEAAEQSGRGMATIIHEPLELKKALETAANNELNLFFDMSGESFTSVGRLENKGPIGLWIGPEGGWSIHDLELTGRTNFKKINLGKTTLRAETAAILASYLAIHNL